MNNIELCINLLERIKDDSWKIQEKENYKRTLMLVRKLLKEEYE